MTLQEKQELNNEVKELVAYFCSLAEANKVEAVSYTLICSYLLL